MSRCTTTRRKSFSLADLLKRATLTGVDLIQEKNGSYVLSRGSLSTTAADLDEVYALMHSRVDAMPHVMRELCTRVDALVGAVLDLHITGEMTAIDSEMSSAALAVKDAADCAKDVLNTLLHRAGVL